MAAAHPLTPDQVLAWLKAHPGQHNAVTIGAALGVSPQTAQRRLAMLTHSGEVKRHGSTRGPNVRWEAAA